MNDYACLPSLASAIPSPWKICSSLLSLVEPSWKLLSPFEGMTPQASSMSDVYLMHPSGCGEMKWLFHFKEKAQSPNLWPRSQNANTYSLALGNASFYDLRFPFGVEMAFLFLPKVLWIRWPKENYQDGSMRAIQALIHSFNTFIHSVPTVFQEISVHHTGVTQTKSPAFIELVWILVEIGEDRW